MQITLAILGAIVGVASLVYALKTQRDKARLEKLIHAKLAGIAGSIVLIRNNPALAHKNIDYILKRLEFIDSSHELKSIVNHLAWAQGDSAAAHRLLEILLLDVLSLQEGMFGSRDVRVPDGEHTILPEERERLG